MSIEFGVILTIFGLIIAFQGYQLNKQKHQREQVKEEKDGAKESAEVKAQLGYISKGVDDIRFDLKTNERQMVALGERVTRVEESTKSLQKRVDKIEGQGEM